ncbi:MAG TPA: sigma-54 dependent transcriptional regulator, partial [Steroidobacteraceae bacterium]|nr:sigma-54 dependent transcriptional regulator [Steroidobacteraceae bacterium]
MNAMRAKALIVDDEPDIRELLGMTLRRMEIEAVAVPDVGTAKRELKAGHFDLCLTDMRLPDGDGLDLVEWIQAHKARVPVAVITAHGNVQSAVRSLKAGAFDFISKPLDLAALRKLISATLKLSDVGDATGVFSALNLTGQSLAMDQLRELIDKVARSQAPVHIYGESGTGKELVARLIHAGGARREGPFVPVNCGAVPSELMESEFFGHRKGSFTGAVADKQGLIQAAEGGTLFLDEIADLPLHMQVKLLRVIQEKTVRAVGDSKEHPIDVRILSATHRNLSELVAAGKFREDLFYRINVIELRVPSLRERVDDIPDLVQTILRRQARALKIERPEVSAEAMEALQQYAFPGNVRELENILERAITLASGRVIERSDIQLRPPPSAEISVAPPVRPVAAGEALGEQLEDIERDAIVKALEQTRYNKTKAAELLGMTFRQLRYRVKK